MQRTAPGATRLALSFRCRLSQCWHAQHRRGTVACSTRRVLQVGRSELGCDEWRNLAQYRSSALCVPCYRPVYPNGRGGDHPTGGVGKPPQPRTNDPLVHFQSGHFAPAQPAPLRPHGNRTRSRREESTLMFRLSGFVCGSMLQRPVKSRGRAGGTCDSERCMVYAAGQQYVGGVCCMLQLIAAVPHLPQHPKVAYTTTLLLGRSG